jgi:polyketide synthase PksN
VLVLRADVADPVAMRQGLAAARARLGAINGIIHAAGIVGGCSLFEKDIEHFHEVLAPKVQGALVLDELIDREALDFVCYFSSSAAILGDFGSCDYAIGNRFQMAFARYQAQRPGKDRVKALAINWPLWHGVGMGAGDAEHIHMMLKSSGQRHLDVEEGLALFDRILAQDAVHPLVLAGQTSRVHRFLGLGALSHRERAEGEGPQRLGNAPHPTPRPGGEGKEAEQRVGARRSGIRPELKGLSLHERVVWDLREHAAQLLQTPREQLRPDENLADFGFDSLSLTDFAARLTDHYQHHTFPVNVTPSLLFGYPTFDKLAVFLLQEYGPAMAEFYRETMAAPTPPEHDTTRPAPYSLSLRERIRVREAGDCQQHTALTPALSQEERGQFPLAADRVEPTYGPEEEEPIAIIGMSGRFPQARTVDDMWDILVGGRDAVAPFPDDRFDWWQFHGSAANRAPARPIHKGEAAAWSCGCIPGVGEFDPLFFEISPVEAEVMDPRQRLLLQEAWNALEDAGYGKSAIESQKIGIFVGAEQGDYQWMTGGKGGVTANHDAMLAARLAYFLNLSGPVLTINTACSSGLVAAHQACASLRNRECDTALAAGVTLVLIPFGLKGMSEAGMLSKDGRCCAFDTRANGIVPGEAVAVLVLKRLSRAQADGDPILAVIKGSGVNYDGKTNGITAPSGVSQTNLITAVYRRYRVNPDEIEYVVTHGTGTKLGDPIEVNALHDAFKAAWPNLAQALKPAYCALTSAKTNFGHTFAASGLVSLISLVQAMRHETIPASLHCAQENEFIDWRDSPLYVNRTNRPWPHRQAPRIGAVSAFGVSGTNAHMVVQSYDRTEREEQHDPDRAPRYLLALSARTREALQAKTDNLLDLLQREGGRLNLARISYTLLQGRHHFAHRCAVVIQDAADAVYVLKQVGAGEKRPNLFQGVVPRDFTGQKATERYAEELVTRIGGAGGEALTQDGDGYRETLYALADLYCQGYDMPWNRMFHAGGRVHLPTYPFSRAEYWVGEDEASNRPSAGPTTVAHLHPLLHQNTSDLTRQRFTSSFTGEEFFLADHRVNGRRILPGVAYLEMARAAVEHALGDSCGASSGGIRLEDVTWLRPFSPDDTPAGDVARLHIALFPEQHGASSGEPRMRYESYRDPEGEEESLLAQGHAVVRPVTEAPVLDLESLRVCCSQRFSAERCYQAFTGGGLDYGPGFRAIDTVFVGADFALARLSLPPFVIDERFVINPSLIDAA